MAGMRRAYFLIDVESGCELRVAQLLREKLGIALADAVSGPHDVIAVVEGSDVGGTARICVSDIRRIQGVRYATACFAVQANQ